MRKHVCIPADDLSRHGRELVARVFSEKAIELELFSNYFYFAWLLYVQFYLIDLQLNIMKQDFP